ncbi:hypothetical protein SAMN05518672_11350 [Chitinophaga sp. CF118]|uniref:DUF4397 domain-containing protein n=1 Tax=Chitinophaga sp. CF118 TaxID=1884367 RepID=UPI0008EBDA5F|nr:DUF4397 domain-containing protein [Chitinophaga sp. CF118]SFE96290.1 hypothetical protein SAMN05518672_11350 [Chitinophaga sp. CF118]
MLKVFKCIFFTAFIFLAACKKGEPVNEYYFASFSAELLALPGTPTVDVYVGDNKIDTLAAGKSIGITSRLMLEAGGKKTKISFKKFGTDTLLLDTLVDPVAGSMFPLKLAFSPTLGIQSFMATGNNTVAADSVSFFAFNLLPVEIQAVDVKVDAYLFKVNGIEYEETGIVLKGFEKNKLHPTLVSLKVIDETGAGINYIFKFKNTATGEFLKDMSLAEVCTIFPLAGKRQILTITATKRLGKLRFGATYAEY